MTAAAAAAKAHCFLGDIGAVVGSAWVMNLGAGTFLCTSQLQLALLSIYWKFHSQLLMQHVCEVRGASSCWSLSQTGSVSQDSSDLSITATCRAYLPHCCCLVAVQSLRTNDCRRMTHFSYLNCLGS